MNCTMLELNLDMGCAWICDLDWIGLHLSCKCEIKL